MSFSPVFGIAIYRSGEDPDDENAGELHVVAEFWCWQDFVEWSESLPGGAYPALAQLCSEGEARNTAGPRDELKQAFKAHRPASLWATRVARRLLKAFGKGDPEAIAMLEV